MSEYWETNEQSIYEKGYREGFSDFKNELQELESALLRVDDLIDVGIECVLFEAPETWFSLDEWVKRASKIHKEIAPIIESIKDKE